MAVKPSRPRIGLAVTLVALALMLVPGSLSAAGAQATDPFDVARELPRQERRSSSASRAPTSPTSPSRASTAPQHLGVTHVNLNQRVQGLEVFTGHVTVNVADDGRVVFAGGSLAPTAIASSSAKIAATDAVEAAADALDLGETSDVSVISEEGGAAQATVVSRAGVSDGPIAARLGWQPTAAGLRKAWQVVIDHSSSDSLWNATIDAETGQLLASDDWTDYDNVDELRARLQRPAVARRSASFAATVVPPSTVDDGSSYRVYQVPNESPNDGPRTARHEPGRRGGLAVRLARHERPPRARVHDDSGSRGARLPRPGRRRVAGRRLRHRRRPRARLRLPGRPDAARAELPRRRRHQPLLHEQRLPRSPLAPRDGRGGGELPGEQLRPRRPRGRLRPGRGGGRQRHEQRQLRRRRPSRRPAPACRGCRCTSGPETSSVPRTRSSSTASARSTPTGRASRPLRRSQARPARSSTQATAASPPTTPARRRGNWIAIVTGDNTGCQNVVKATQASAAGAEALVVAGTDTGASPILTGAMTAAPPTIPVASITLADGNAIRAAITAGPTTGTVRKHPSHPGIRDGDFENGIIIHEYGHGVSNRLTGGPAVNCLSGNEQAGEGWSDFLAISTLLDPALDNPNQPRGMGPYALFQADRHGNGIRPRPYTRDMSIQPFTYDSIKTGGWLTGIVAGPPARPRPRLGGDPLGHDLGPDRQARVHPEHLRGLERGREHPRAAVRDGRPQAPGLRAGPRRRARGDHRRRRHAQRR